MTRGFAQLRSWLGSHRNEIGTVAIGHSAKQLEEILFDWLLYGSVIAACTTTWGPMWGSVAGFTIMTPLSAVVCFAYIRLYDWGKKDWFGFELLKGLRDDAAGGSRLERLVHRVARLGDVAAFMALSVYGDPFMTTVYLRRGVRRFNGLSSSEWVVFWLSVLVSNGYWTLRWTILVEVARFVWSLFRAIVLMI
jgi:hypothetical protein